MAYASLIPVAPSPARWMAEAAGGPALSAYAPPPGFGLAIWDEIDHLLVFAGLAVLMRLAWPELGRWRALIALIGYGAAIELAQALPGLSRSASLIDLAADGVGAGLGLALAWSGAALGRRRAP